MMKLIVIFCFKIYKFNTTPLKIVNFIERIRNDHNKTFRTYLIISINIIFFIVEDQLYIYISLNENLTKNNGSLIKPLNPSQH